MRSESICEAFNPAQTGSIVVDADRLLFHSLSILEHSSKNSLPDLLIPGCSAALFGPALPDELTKKTASSA